MTKVAVLLDTDKSSVIGTSIIEKTGFEGKRHLTQEEIKILQDNNNISSDPKWQNIFVSDEFCPESINSTEFSGTVIIGKLRKAKLRYHDLTLRTGIFNSYIESCVIGDDVCIKNVSYLQNYKIGNRVMIFNVQEMSCTLHSKFGNGFIKEGEDEANRIWIGIGNENDGRQVLPFEDMITADAYLWSRYREDHLLMNRFIELTENLNEKKQNTFGFVDNDTIIKNTVLIKDAKIGECTYIKGAFKLKNITICSSEQEPSQIGEGVELVNGILGYGSKVFYQAVAVRFVIGRNCQLKYGVRVLNSIIGDNSTVSCCEILNNLVFPFHEQHHNSSFLIATTIKGQSNIAAGATIGSNHNSRSPDGEIIAGRGFWPGLCSDFKHNSKFASFTLIAKGSYQTELNITYPFSLVSICSKDQSITIMPAYWFLYNMFAMARNNSKFLKRDKRKIKIQHIETDPFAPDTMQEVLFSIDRIITLTGRWLTQNDEWFKSQKAKDIYQLAKDYLHHNPDSEIVLEDSQCMKRYGAKILKPARGYKEYRKITKYFAVKTLVEFCSKNNEKKLTKEVIDRILNIDLFTEWDNVGGQIIPIKKIEELFSLIKSKKIVSWQQVHEFYDECDAEYLNYKTRYAIFLLEQLYSRPISDFTHEIFEDAKNDVLIVSNYMYESSISSREKDFTDYFRAVPYRNKEEMEAVLGTLESNEFLKQLKIDTVGFNKQLEVFFKDI